MGGLGLTWPQFLAILRGPAGPDFSKQIRFLHEFQLTKKEILQTF